MKARTRKNGRFASERVVKDVTLVLRLTARHKARIRRAAERLGMTVSAFVLSRALEASR